jgi:hypothetical protein
MKKNSLLLCFLCTQLFFSQIGINTTVPNQSAMLDIVSNNKGVLVPRIALSSRTDAATIPSPATGLIIYNTTTAGIGGDQITPGLTINTGTPANPIWASLQVITNTQGHTTDKLRYLGLPDITKTTSVGGFLEFRVRQSGISYNFEMRLLNPPTSNIIYRYARIGYGIVPTTGEKINNGYASNFTFTPTNYNVWQVVDAPFLTTGTLGFHGVLSSPNRDAMHELILNFTYGEFVNCVINTY